MDSQKETLMVLDLFPFTKFNQTLNMASSSSSSPPPPPQPPPFLRDSPWSQLPTDLLISISSNFTHIVDYIQFRSLCSSWRSAAKSSYLPPQLPRLLLPHDSHSSSREFFDLVYSQHHGKISTFFSHEPRRKSVCGSSFGFLALIDVESVLSLWNSFTRSLIYLPRPISLPSYLGFHVSPYTAREPGHRNDIDLYNSPNNYGNIRRGYPWKVSLSAHPSDTLGCVVTVVLADSQDFAFCKLGDETWTIVKTTLLSPIVSVVFLGGKFYAFDKNAVGVVLDRWLSNKSTFIPKPELDDNTELQQLYVVVEKAEGKLLMVLCYLMNEINLVYDDEADDDVEIVKPKLTIGVFKLDSDGEQYKWSRVKSIGNLALFLSGNHSSAIDSRDFGCCREDCIYFSFLYVSPRDHLQREVHYMDVFDMKENKFQPLSGPWIGISKGLQNATWLIPSIYSKEG